MSNYIRWSKTVTILGHYSFGLAVCDKNDKIQTAKTVGRLKDLQIITHDSIFE